MKKITYFFASLAFMISLTGVSLAQTDRGLAGTTGNTLIQKDTCPCPQKSVQSYVPVRRDVRRTVAPKSNSGNVIVNVNCGDPRNHRCHNSPCCEYGGPVNVPPGTAYSQPVTDESPAYAYESRFSNLGDVLIYLVIAIIGTLIGLWIFGSTRKGSSGSTYKRDYHAPIHNYYGKVINYYGSVPPTSTPSGPKEKMPDTSDRSSSKD